MARFYADENFDLGVVRWLRGVGHDVLTVQEAGERGRDDERVLERATSDGRCVLTFDKRDFKRLHQQKPGNAGIVVCTRDDDIDALAARIDAACGGSILLQGQLIIVLKP